jgi:hypothetical protein
MINIGMDESITKAISLLIKIQGEKRYVETDDEFLNMYSVIKGILDESRGINSEVLKELLVNFDKREGIEKFKLIKQLMTEMKNLLAKPVNQLIFNITANGESKKGKTNLIEIEEDGFTCLIKNLCKISQEYLISFLSTIPANQSIIKGTVRGVSYINLLNAIFSNSNSLAIAKTYTQLFNSYLEIFNTTKTVKESDRLKIFISLVKFLYRNNKKDIKATSLYKSVQNAIKNFFSEIKSEATYLAINNILLTKFVNSKYKLPKGVLKLTEAFLDHKNMKLVENTIETYFTIIQKKLMTVSLYELYSNEKKLYLKKYAFLLNNLLTRYNYYEKHKIYRLKECFNQNLYKLFDDNESGCKVVIILFFLSLTDSSANAILHKYFMDCLDLYYRNLDTLNKFFANNLLETEYTIKPVIEKEESRTLLLDLYTKKDQLGKEARNKFLGDILSDIDDSECIEFIKRGFLIYFSHSDINDILGFTNQLLFSIDESNQSNDFLQAILSVLFYYLYLQKYKLEVTSQDYIDNCNTVLDIIQGILQLNISSRNIVNYIKVILVNLYDLEILRDKIKTILKDMFDFAYRNHRVAMKPFAKLILELNSLTGVYNLPEEFESKLFTDENKIASLMFINEILKNDKTKYNSIVFQEKYQIYIFQTLNAEVNENYNNLIQDIPDDDSSAAEAKTALCNLIILQYEILTYEFYLNIITDSPKGYLKMIFLRLYELTEHQVRDDDKKIQKLLLYLNNLNINKCINVVFKFFDNDISIKQKYIIRLSNIAIYNDISVRNHFLNKLENIIAHKNISMASLNLLPISSLYFNDPDRIIKKRSTQLFADYLKLLVKKYEQYKSDDIIRIYKFLPEFVLSSILMFFIFNSNLNKYHYSGHYKYFESILISYFKLMKKVSNEKYDSSLLIQNCLKIKRSNLKNQKIIKRISENTYLRLSMSKTAMKMELTSSHYDSVKNELSDMTVKIIGTDYSTKFRHENIKTILDQSIFNSRVSEISYENKGGEFIPQSELKQHLNELKDLSEIKVNDSLVNTTELNNLNLNVKFIFTI